MSTNRKALVSLTLVARTPFEKVFESVRFCLGGYHKSRGCSKDTYPESYITKYTRIRRSKAFAEMV